jgi:DNA-binding LacI/PurR family transcriptional regulator
VHVPKEDMGLYAVQVLIDHSTRHDIPSAAVILPTNLIIRESCGALR